MWSLLLSLMLLCAQGVQLKLHVHELDHEHDNYHSHTHATGDESDHSHLSKAHFAHDTSHDNHHDNIVSEVDITPDGFLKSASNTVFAIALFALSCILVTFIPSRQFFQRCRESKLILYNYYLFSPPLRAPPQY